MTRNSAAGAFGPWLYSSYVINEGVFGGRPGHPVRRRGKLTAVRYPAGNLLLCDGLPRQERGRDYLLALAAGTANLNLFSGTGSPTILDHPRHRRRLNVLLADFHVETRFMTVGGLSEVGLTFGF
jgi:prepilin-type processing-associated H-X9-DG protein